MVTDFIIGKTCEIRVLPSKYKKHHMTLINATGEIKELYKNLIGVRISGLMNAYSTIGLFWFKENEITILEDKTMTYDKAKDYDKNAKFASVQNPAKTDSLDVAVYYGDLKEGDIVVCDYGRPNNSLSTRKVHTANLDRDTICYVDCEIMGVCDISAYLEHKTKIERRAELKKQMIEQAKKYQEEEYWRLISESNPAMKALYDEFKALED